MKRIIVLSLLSVTLTACSGVHQSEDTFDTHAENVNFLFLQIPGGDTQERAMALVPNDAKVVTIKSTTSDETSFLGIMNRIFGIDQTKVSGVVKKG